MAPSLSVPDSVSPVSVRTDSASPVSVCTCIPCPCQAATGGTQQMVLQQSPQIVQTQDGQTVLFQPVQMDGAAQVSAAPAAAPAAAATPQVSTKPSHTGPALSVVAV